MTTVSNKPTTLNHVIDELVNQWPLFTTPAQKAYSFNALTNVYEQKEEYVIEILAANAQKENFKLKLNNNVLKISYQPNNNQNSTADKNYVQREFASVKAFSKNFNLDEKINAEGIAAAYNNGVLKISLPKKEAEVKEPKEIAVS